MIRRVWFMTLMGSVGFISQALAAADVTPAAAAITALGTSAMAWGFAIAALAFVTAIAAKLLEHFYDVRSLSGSAVNVLIGVALISSVVAILGTAGAAAGADVSSVTPVIDLMEVPF